MLINRGFVRLAGTVDDLTTRHRLLTGPVDRQPDPTWQIVQSGEAGSQRHLLVQLHPDGDPQPAGWQSRTVGIEELAMAYLRETPSRSRPTPVEVAP